MRKAISVLLLVLTAVGLSCGCGTGAKSYTDARKTCDAFLVANKEEMTAIANDLLTNRQNEKSGRYKGFDYALIGSDDRGRYIKFEIGAQGLLGGQYWSLVFCPDGALFDEDMLYSWKQPDGNNIIKAEKIDGNWWYYWEDFDGTKYSDQ